MSIDRMKTNVDWLPKKMLPETRKYLANYYSDDINQLETLLEFDLSHWK